MRVGKLWKALLSVVLGVFLLRIEPLHFLASLEDGLLAIIVSFRVELLNERDEVVFLRAVVDHSLQSLVVRTFVNLHVALLVDPLELRELSVVNHEHHDAGLVYQNLESLEGKLVRVVVDIEHLLLVVGLLLG